MPPEVYTITQTNRALSNEQSGRTKRYLISMGIRTACVLAAIVVPGWPKWVFIAGAVVLPYLAVVIANAGRENDEPGSMGVAHVSLPSAASAQEYQRRASRSIEQ
jgi:type III secretory pathway component EscV